VRGNTHTEFTALMQMRSDGLLGFPGAIADSATVQLEDVANHALSEQVSSRATIAEGDYATCLSVETADGPSCSHLFVKEVSEDRLELLEMDALRLATTKALGTVRVPFYQLPDGGGFPLFITQRFQEAALQQLLMVASARGLIGEAELNSAVQAAGLAHLVAQPAVGLEGRTSPRPSDALQWLQQESTTAPPSQGEASPTTPVKGGSTGGSLLMDIADRIGLVEGGLRQASSSGAPGLLTPQKGEQQEEAPCTPLKGTVAMGVVTPEHPSKHASMASTLSGTAENSERPALETVVKPSSEAAAPRWSKQGGPTLCVFTKKPIQAVEGARVGFIRRTWTVTKVQAHYIQQIAEKYNLQEAGGMLMDGQSYGVAELVKQANSEDKKTKKLIFKIVRCFNCTMGKPCGGEKVEVSWDLRPIHMMWLENVCKQCAHSSIDKTMRIMLDFYMSYANKDTDLERALFDTKQTKAADAFSRPANNLVSADAAESSEVNAALQGALVEIYQQFPAAVSGA